MSLARHTPTLTGDKKLRALSVDSALFPHIGDAITNLADILEWKEVGDSVDDIVAEMKEAVELWYSDMLIGVVSTFLVTPPPGWLLLDGATYLSADYPELSDLLPAHLISGSDFILPDVEDAFPFGVSAEDDGSQVTGSNDLALTVGQLPAHDHSYTPPVFDVDFKSVGTPNLTAASVGAPTTTGSIGDGDNIDNRPLRFGLIYAVFSGRV